MKKMPNKSVYSIHKQVAKDQFAELKYKGEDRLKLQWTFIQDYFNKRIKKVK